MQMPDVSLQVIQQDLLEEIIVHSNNGILYYADA